MEERLQKLIAEAGVASRRKAEQLITAGEVSVNGTVVTELGTKADPERDHIRVSGRLINADLTNRELVYVLLNKPRGYLSSTKDPEDRPLAIDLLPPNLRGKVHTVGRLDFNTEGLLILTNDGNLTDAVTRAGRVPKVYHVKVKGTPPEPLVERLKKGIPIEGRRTRPALIEQLDRTDAGNTWYRVVLVQGRNQQIRKMFDAIGHSVVKLQRVQIGPVTDAGLPTGRSRPLTPAEVKKLMAASQKEAEDAAIRVPNAGPVGKPGGPTRRAEVTSEPRKGGFKKGASKTASKPAKGGSKPAARPAGKGASKQGAAKAGGSKKGTSPVAARAARRFGSGPARDDAPRTPRRRP
jgi:23S rRNA pseudouridine2605 synthase